MQLNNQKDSFLSGKNIKKDVEKLKKRWKIKNYAGWSFFHMLFKHWLEIG
jgi:hypothetical protein